MIAYSDEFSFYIGNIRYSIEACFEFESIDELETESDMDDTDEVIYHYHGNNPRRDIFNSAIKKSNLFEEVFPFLDRRHFCDVDIDTDDITYGKEITEVHYESTKYRKVIFHKFVETENNGKKYKVLVLLKREWFSNDERDAEIN